MVTTASGPAPDRTECGSALPAVRGVPAGVDGTGLTRGDPYRVSVRRWLGLTVSACAGWLRR